MISLRVLAAAAIGVLSAACASVQSRDATYEVGSHPEPGVRSAAFVGQAMVSHYDYLANVIATLRGPIGGSFWAGREGLAAGTQLVAAVSEGREVFCHPPRRMGAPCVADTNGDGRFDQASTMNAYGMLVNRRDIEPAAYRASDRSIQDGFKYELIYQGLDDGTLRIAYREFRDNLARPAFSQDLTYTLSPEGETEVRFRDVIMAVHSANNSQVDYTLIRGFATHQ